MALEDIFKGITEVAGGYFNAQAASETAQQTNSLAALQLQAQSNRDVLGAQTSQKTALYVAMAVGAVALIVLYSKRVG